MSLYSLREADGRLIFVELWILRTNWIRVSQAPRCTHGERHRGASGTPP